MKEGDGEMGKGVRYPVRPRFHHVNVVGTVVGQGRA